MAPPFLSTQTPSNSEFNAVFEALKLANVQGLSPNRLLSNLHSTINIGTAIINSVSGVVEFPDHIRIKSTVPSIKLFETDGSANENWHIDIASGRLRLVTMDDSGSTTGEKFAFTQNGKFGIGKFPSVEIDVVGAGAFTGNVSAGSFSGGNVANWNSAYAYELVGHLPLSGGIIAGDLSISSATPIFRMFETDGSANENWRFSIGDGTLLISTMNDVGNAISNVFRILQNGKVGINKSPAVDFDILGNAHINNGEQVHSGEMSAIDDNGDKHITEVFTGTTFAGANGGVVAIIGAGVNIESTITSVSWSLDTTADHRLESIDSFSYCSFDGTNTLLTISNTYYPLKAITIYVTRKI